MLGRREDMASDELVEQPNARLSALCLQRGIRQMRGEIETRPAVLVSCRLRWRYIRDGGEEGQDALVDVEFDGPRRDTIYTKVELDMA